MIPMEISWFLKGWFNFSLPKPKKKNFLKDELTIITRCGSGSIEIVTDIKFALKLSDNYDVWMGVEKVFSLLVRWNKSLHIPIYSKRKISNWNIFIPAHFGMLIAPTKFRVFSEINPLMLEYIKIVALRTPYNLVESSWCLRFASVYKVIKLYIKFSFL